MTSQGLLNAPDLVLDNPNLFIGDHPCRFQMMAYGIRYLSKYSPLLCQIINTGQKTGASRLTHEIIPLCQIHGMEAFRPVQHHDERA